MSQTPSPTDTPPILPRRRRRRWFIAASIALLLAAFHAPLLRGVGRALVTDEAPPAGCDLIIFGGDRAYDRAALLVQDGTARRVYVVEARPLRVQVLGAVPMWEEIARRELSRRGIPPDRIGVIRGPAGNAWELARAVGDWMREHPGSTAAVLTDQFSARHDRLLLHRRVGPADRARVSLLGLRHREYDETNWWRRKSGVLAVGNAYFRLGHAWVIGEGPALSPKSPDDLDGLVP